MLSVIASIVQTNAGFLPEQVELARAGAWGQLASLAINPNDFETAWGYARANSLSTLLKKCAGLVAPDDLHAKAVATFHLCEKRNRRTNVHLDRFIKNECLTLYDEPYAAFFDAWKKNVNVLLGKPPSVLFPRFSGGASFFDKGKLTTLPDKLTGRVGCTEGIQVVFHHSPNAWRDLFYDRRWTFEVSRGSRFTSVPKDSFKNRGICVEPLANVAFQLDVGTHLRKRLRRFGIDLDNIKVLHNDLAQLASLSGALATLDLSNASDLMSRSLVQLLVREDWYDILDTLRCHETFVEGSWFRVEKFSSMGNGFTFELMTVLFVTLGWTLGAADISVCGDDIIVPAELAKPMMAALEYVGFEVNHSKSFWEGKFFESCGGDFFSGFPVRGPYMKQLPATPDEWISLHNTLAAFTSVDDVWDPLRALCIESVPLDVQRCVVPVELGDCGFHLSGWRDGVEMRPARTRAKHQRNNTPLAHYRAWLPVQRHLEWCHWSDDVRLVSVLTGADPHRVLPRDSVSGYKLGWVAFPG